MEYMKAVFKKKKLRISTSVSPECLAVAQHSAPTPPSLQLHSCILIVSQVANHSMTGYPTCLTSGEVTSAHSRIQKNSGYHPIDVWNYRAAL
jgi:hypothetical protein